MRRGGCPVWGVWMFVCLPACGLRTQGSGDGDVCGGCGPGYDCFPARYEHGGVCAPLCDSLEESAWGKPCGNTVSGGGGICFPFSKGSTTAGVCTRKCSPLLQDCPEHFACDITDDSADVMHSRVFACLPVVESQPRSLGANCDGGALGQCTPGSSCIPAVTPGVFANCLALCDQGDSTSCPKPQTCVKPNFFPSDPVGVCRD
jgi:hypothetical protein